MCILMVKQILFVSYAFPHFCLQSNFSRSEWSVQVWDTNNCWSDFIIILPINNLPRETDFPRLFYQPRICIPRSALKRIKLQSMSFISFSYKHCTSVLSKCCCSNNYLERNNLALLCFHDRFKESLWQRSTRHWLEHAGIYTVQII